jgi:hypothetical protein
MGTWENIDFSELSKQQQQDIIEKGYSIICDNTNNAQEDIDNRRINVTVIWREENVSK